jgi:hypothetical protein
MEAIHFEGKCDVCHEPIAMDYDSSGGIIDYYIDQGRMVTWVRHYATAPAGANPDCAVYSSKVFEVKKELTNDT